MRLSFQRDDALYFLHAEVVACGLILRRKLLDDRSLSESHVVLICRQNLAGVLGSGLLYHCEERTLHLLAVDDKRSAEYLVSAVLRVNLSEAENLRVRERPSVLFLYLVQVFYLLGRERETFLLVEFPEVFHILYRFRLVVNAEHILSDAVIHTLKHRVVLGILRTHGEVLLDTRNALQVHVLRDFYRIGTPRRNHLASRAYEKSLQLIRFQIFRIAIEPAQFVNLVFVQLMVYLSCNYILF